MNSATGLRQCGIFCRNAAKLKHLRKETWRDEQRKEPHLELLSRGKCKPTPCKQKIKENGIVYEENRAFKAAVPRHCGGITMKDNIGVAKARDFSMY